MVKYQIDTKAVESVLDWDNTAVVKRNKDGEVIVLEIRKKIVKSDKRG